MNNYKCPLLMMRDESEHHTDACTNECMLYMTLSDSRKVIHMCAIAGIASAMLSRGWKVSVNG